MIVRCPGCGAETELENSNSVQETECSACHQKLVVGQLERQSQSPNHSKCPLPLKGASVVYLLIGCVVAIVSTKVRVDFFGSFDWIGGFWSVVSCIALIAGSYCFLIGQRLGRAFFAMSVVLGVLSKHVFLSMWLCLPLVFSLGKSSRDWFACNGGWLHFLKATIGLRLWVKLLFGLYFLRLRA